MRNGDAERHRMHSFAARGNDHVNRQTHRWEKWRKVAGVEPARERMPSPTGFEARPRHRARLPSLNSVGAGTGQRVVETDLSPFANPPGQAEAVEVFEDLDTAFASQA